MPPPKNILIVSSPRCKSTVVTRLLADTHAKIICEPFTQAFYGPQHVEHYNPDFPSTYSGAIEYIRELVDRHKINGPPLVIKILAYQAFDAFVQKSSQAFIDFLRTNFYIIYLIRKPMDVCNSIARKLINLNEPATSLAEFCCYQDMYALMKILKPMEIISVNLDINPNPLKFVQRIWSRTDNPRLFISCDINIKLNDFPELTAEEISSAGLDIWPSWYNRALTRQYNKSIQHDNSHFTQEFLEQIKEHYPQMRYYYHKLLSFSCLLKYCVDTI